MSDSGTGSDKGPHKYCCDKTTFWAWFGLLKAHIASKRPDLMWIVYFVEAAAGDLTVEHEENTLGMAEVIQEQFLLKVFPAAASAALATAGPEPAAPTGRGRSSTRSRNAEAHDAGAPDPVLVLARKQAKSQLAVGQSNLFCIDTSFLANGEEGAFRNTICGITDKQPDCASVLLTKLMTTQGSVSREKGASILLKCIWPVAKMHPNSSTNELTKLLRGALPCHHRHGQRGAARTVGAVRDRPALPSTSAR